MPFETTAGPAVLVENICSLEECSERLNVHMNSIYNWVKLRKRTNFPHPLPCGRKFIFDYAEVYDWFKLWVLEHPTQYPNAFAALSGGEK